MKLRQFHGLWSCEIAFNAIMSLSECFSLALSNQEVSCLENFQSDLMGPHTSQSEVFPIVILPNQQFC